MLVQAVGQQALLLTVDADKEGDDQPDTTTVHILKLTEIQNDAAGGWYTRFCIGFHEHLFCKSSDFSLDVDDAGYRAYLANIHHDVGLRHWITPYICGTVAPRFIVGVHSFAAVTDQPARALVSSGKTLMK